MDILSVRVGGPLACFTRPELKAERVSYGVMTPSAARGVLEAILWKPAIRWRIERIKVLAPIRWIAFRRNEVSNRAASPSTSLIEQGGEAPCLLIEDERAQRNTVALRDVDYIIEARFEMTDCAGREDNPAKFVDMFRRRLEKGQHFHQPYLGCREFVAEVGPVDDVPAPVAESANLGLMLYDIDFASEHRRAVFFDAKLRDGVLDVPATAEAAIATIQGGSP